METKLRAKLEDRKQVYRWLLTLSKEEVAGFCITLMTDEEIKVEAIGLK